MYFHLVPKSVTLDDLQGDQYAASTLFYITHTWVFQSSVKLDLNYQQRKCSSWTVVSGSIKFIWIFVRVPWIGASDKSSGSVLSVTVSWNLQR